MINNPIGKVEYKPTSTEMVSETARMARGALSALYSGSKYLLGMTLFPYALPTTLKPAKENSAEEQKWNEYSFEKRATLFTLAGLGIAFSWGGQIGAYAYLADKGYPEVFYIPLATNLVSSI